MAAQNAIARPRSLGGKTLVMIERVAGMMNAPPMPIAARVNVSWVGECAIADANENVPNTASPRISAPRRPKRSPRLPAVSSKPANTSV